MKRPLIWLGISLGALALCGLLVVVGATMGGVVYYVAARGLALPPRRGPQEAPAPRVPNWLQPEGQGQPWAIPRTEAPWLTLGRLRPVVVTRVVSDSPAEEAGLEPQDVIIAVDGKGLEAGHDLSQIVLAHEPGDDLVLAIVRANHHLDLLHIEVTLGRHTGVRGGEVAYLGIFYRDLQPGLRFVPPPGDSWD
ncbi:MAG TPA: PDZ domain-containing protein [Chloroflexi bacterium]|nr:PDZ domain-containing protein [Chloroflexota bacterium]